jgi:hypothetical protein
MENESKVGRWGIGNRVFGATGFSRLAKFISDQTRSIVDVRMTTNMNARVQT